MKVVCGPTDEGFPAVLMSAVTGFKLAKLGWNKIEHQNTFSNIFFIFTLLLVSTEHWKCIYILAYKGLHENKTRNGFTPLCIILKIICNHTHYKSWDKITYPLANAHGAYFTGHVINYLLLELKFIHASTPDV